jgi:hypothetical protein
MRQHWPACLPACALDRSHCDQVSTSLRTPPSTAFPVSRLPRQHAILEARIYIQPGAIKSDSRKRVLCSSHPLCISFSHVCSIDLLSHRSQLPI